MSRTDVHCTKNTIAIETNADHVEGGQLRFVIQPHDAFIDSQGCIRVFTINWQDLGPQVYKLLPYHTRPEEIALWVVDFLAGYGLSRAGGKVIKGNTPVANVSRYLTFGVPGGAMIRSFVSGHFLPQHLGYHNIATDKVIFTKPLFVGRW